MLCPICLKLANQQISISLQIIHTRSSSAVDKQNENGKQQSRPKHYRNRLQLLHTTVCATNAPTIPNSATVEHRAAAARPQAQRPPECGAAPVWWAEWWRRKQVR